MSNRSILRWAFALIVQAALVAAVHAQSEIIQRKVDIQSEGTRISGLVMHARTTEPRKLPAIVMAHGWGGTAAMLQPYAEQFAQAGYFVLAFDYRGWGESDARKIRADPASPELRDLREVVDPIDQATDFFNAIHWVMGESLVDTARIGLWGTSFSGGLVAYVAARDPRVKALVSQVAYFGIARDKMPAAQLARSESDATQRSRGELRYPEPGVREIGRLRGAPIRESFLRYAPIEDIGGISGTAMLIIDAEKEELFDLREHGALAFERAREPKKRVVMPGIAHYGIYQSAREEATRLAIDWYDQHLKP